MRVCPICKRKVLDGVCFGTSKYARQEKKKKKDDGFSILREFCVICGRVVVGMWSEKHRHNGFSLQK